METADYLSQFDDILDGSINEYPYDDEAYINYVKLNKSRLKRWNKMGKISAELAATLNNIEQAQQWILITEPWCGDAANIQVFIEKSAQLNPLIKLTYRNRDAEGSEIDNYLTNGGKSIPKLVVRNSDGDDLFTWGPRPKEAQELHLKQRNDDSLEEEEKKINLQKWYNSDKGNAIQDELNILLKKTLSK